ncbi:Ankyrin-2 [Cytospora mali]|uniref:Ankyrin-2 n=1 Tax=Cytospora mali TaxID=578113 RepID=A0A194V3B4_CYTMA|nr:Ankyrin-2 [Valsa mali var. pyri (nom. inval.)]
MSAITDIRYGRNKPAYGESVLYAAVAHGPLENTNLSVAMRNIEHLDIAELLVEKGASPDFGCQVDTTMLLIAAARGDESEVRHLLDEGVEVDSKDGFGFTALYEAARFGRDQIVKLLIDYGAVVDAKVGPGGETALHGAVDRGQDYQYFSSKLEGRGSLRNLADDHIQVVQTLLRSGLIPHLKRRDGKTVQTLVLSRLRKGGLGDDAKTKLQEILHWLENPPPVERSTLRPKWHPLPPKLDAQKAHVCGYFKARIQYHTPWAFRYKMLPISDLIYDRSKSAYGQIKALDDWASANNHTIRALHKFLKLDSHPMELENFIDDYYYELRGSAPYARCRRPIISMMPESSSRALSVVMPFFDMETEEYLEPTKDVEDKQPFKMKQKLEEVYRHGGEEVEDLHLARTLDQSYYMSLSDSTDIKNQVVFRYTKSRAQSGYNSNHSKDIISSNMMHLRTETNTRKNPASVAGRPGKDRKAKLLMVNQMWLWKLDEPISDPGTEARRNLREAARKEVSNISDEVKYLWEIKDNRDELKMIDRVLEDQSNVLNKYSESLVTKWSSVTSTGGIGTLQELAYSRDKVQRLIKEAEDVEASLSRLLDLKQKEANLYEAVDTRRLADEAVKRKRESERQEQLLFVFTAVTVIYTPLSFAAAFFAVPSQDFPQSGNALSRSS